MKTLNQKNFVMFGDQSFFLASERIDNFTFHLLVYFNFLPERLSCLSVASERLAVVMNRLICWGGTGSH